MLRVSWREGVPSNVEGECERGCVCTVEGELERAATVWVQPPLSPPLVPVFHAAASHFKYILLHTSSPAHSSSPPLPPLSPSSSSISPCSEVEHGSFSTWLGCTGVLWATLVRPLSAISVPSTYVRISTVMSGLWGSPTH